MFSAVYACFFYVHETCQRNASRPVQNKGSPRRTRDMEQAWGAAPDVIDSAPHLVADIHGCAVGS
jgi:hypothetical protein